MAVEGGRQPTGLVFVGYGLFELPKSLEVDKGNFLRIFENGVVVAVLARVRM